MENYNRYLKSLIETVKDIKLNSKLNKYKNYRFILQSELLPNLLNNRDSEEILEEIKKVLRDNRVYIDKFILEVQNEIKRDTSCEVAKNMNFEYQKIFESIIDRGIKNIKYIDARDLNLFLEAEKFIVGEGNELPCSCVHCTSYQGHLNLVILLLNGIVEIEEASLCSLNMRERLQLVLLEEESRKNYGFINEIPSRYENTHLIKVYLDQNTISRCVRDEEFYKAIMESKSKYKFFYSPSHLEEIFKWEHQDNKIFIEKLSSITDDVIVIPWKEDEKKQRLELFYESPYKGLLRTRINAPKSAEILEEIKYIRDYRNNITYNKFLKKSHTNKINDASNAGNIFESHRSLVEDILSDLNCSFVLEEVKNQNTVYEDYELINDIVYKLSSSFDILNFKKDSSQQKIKSSVHDIEHLIYASRGDVFVTEDKKLLERAKQIFAFVLPRIRVYHVDKCSEMLKENKTM